MVIQFSVFYSAYAAFCNTLAIRRLHPCMQTLALLLRNVELQSIFYCVFIIMPRPSSSFIPFLTHKAVQLYSLWGNFSLRRPLLFSRRLFISTLPSRYLFRSSSSSVLLPSSILLFCTTSLVHSLLFHRFFTLVAPTWFTFTFCSTFLIHSLLFHFLGPFPLSPDLLGSFSPAVPPYNPLPYSVPPSCFSLPLYYLLGSFSLFHSLQPSVSPYFLRDPPALRHHLHHTHLHHHNAASANCTIYFPLSRNETCRIQTSFYIFCPLETARKQFA